MTIVMSLSSPGKLNFWKLKEYSWKLDWKWLKQDSGLLNYDTLKQWKFDNWVQQVVQNTLILLQRCGHRLFELLQKVRPVVSISCFIHLHFYSETNSPHTVTGETNHQKLTDSSGLSDLNRHTEEEKLVNQTQNYILMLN